MAGGQPVGSFQEQKKHPQNQHSLSMMLLLKLFDEDPLSEGLQEVARQIDTFPGHPET